MNKSIVIKDIYSYEQIGCGSEGTVHKYNNKIAFKIFSPFANKDKLQKKFIKLEALSNLKDNNFVFPQGYVLDKEDEIIGYYMNLIKSDKDYNDIKELKDIRKVLELIIKADTAIQRIHQKHVYLGDIRGDNILIDNKNNPMFIDTDNFYYKNYDFDLKSWNTTWLNRTYNEDYSLKDIDIYTYAIRSIQFILDTYNCNIEVKKYNNDEYFKKLIDLMYVDDEIKDELRTIFSNKKNKPYIGPILKKIRPNNILFDKEELTNVLTNKTP